MCCVVIVMTMPSPTWLFPLNNPHRRESDLVNFTSPDTDTKYKLSPEPRGLNRTCPLCPHHFIRKKEDPPGIMGNGPLTHPTAASDGRLYSGPGHASCPICCPRLHQLHPPHYPFCTLILFSAPDSLKGLPNKITFSSLFIPRAWRVQTTYKLHSS